MFVLSPIPPGTYDLVATCVGYTRRTRRVSVGTSDTLFLEIALEPRPVPSRGVEVQAERDRLIPTSPSLLFPGPGDGSYCLYGTDVSVPVGVLFSDSALYMYALDTAVVDSEKYIRLWLLYENLSRTPYDLDPERCLNLRVTGRGRDYADIRAEDPSDMEAAVRRDDLPGDLARRIGNTFETLLFFQQLIRPGVPRTFGPIDAKQGTEYDKSGKMEVRWRLERDPALRGAASEFLAASFRKSHRSGILRRCLVYPENSVNGFVYFPFPGIDWGSGSTGLEVAYEYRYTLEILTPSGGKTIVFTAH